MRVQMLIRLSPGALLSQLLRARPAARSKRAALQAGTRSKRVALNTHGLLGSVGVFPVFVTGLHCGDQAWERRGRSRPVFPVFVTGLHCGAFTGSSQNWPVPSSRSS